MSKLQTAVLEADVVSYSKLTDKQKLAIDALLTSFLDSIKHLESSHVKRTGDGLLICLPDCSDAGEAALKLRDAFRQHNWKKHGFEKPQSIRVGLHFGLIHLNDDKSEVSGDVIVVANRIQTITDHNAVFVSQAFKLNSMSLADDRFSFRDLGERELAKSHGAMQLNQLLWSVEELPETPRRTTAPYVPKVPNRITDRDRAEFTRQSYQRVFTLFSEWASGIQQENPRITVDIEKVSEVIFIATLYLDDSIVESLKIWSGGFASTDGISCCLGQSSNKHETSSCNESLSVHVEDGTLCLQSMMKSFHSSHDEEYDLSFLTIEQAAIHLWKMLTSSLESRIR